MLLYRVCNQQNFRCIVIHPEGLTMYLTLFVKQTPNVRYYILSVDNLCFLLVLRYLWPELYVFGVLWQEIDLPKFRFPVKSHIPNESRCSREVESLKWTLT